MSNALTNDLPDDDDSREIDRLDQLAKDIAAKLEKAAMNDRHGLMPHQIEALNASAHHLKSPIGAEIVLPEDQAIPDICLSSKVTGPGKIKSKGWFLFGLRLIKNEHRPNKFTKK